MSTHTDVPMEKLQIKIKQQPKYQKNPLWTYPIYPHYTPVDWEYYDSQRLPPLPSTKR